MRAFLIRLMLVALFVPALVLAVVTAIGTGIAYTAVAVKNSIQDEMKDFSSSWRNSSQ